MSAQHTPGPWMVNPTGDIGPWIVGTMATEIANCAGSDVEQSETEANARLIAVAPELLTVLREVTEFSFALANDQSGYESALKSFCTLKRHGRLTIAKAEGRQP